MIEPATGRKPTRTSPAARASRRALHAWRCALAVVALSAGPAALADPVVSGNVTAELVSEHQSIRPGGMFTLGISLRPAEGWHTYWQNSGDSGLPTAVEWKLPAGVHAGEMQWPRPVRLGKPPFVTYGYERDALLLTHFDAPSSLEPGKDVEVSAAVRWLACRDDACIPGRAELRTVLRVAAAEPAADPKWKDAFALARASLPRVGMDWFATAREDEKAIRVDVSAPPQRRPDPKSISVFPIQSGVVDASADPVIQATETGYTIELARDQKQVPLPEMLELVLVAADADGGSARTLRFGARKVVEPPPKAAKAAPAAAAAKPAAARPRAGITFWAAIVLAVAGGLVLNLMPCVFPVLSLKILGFVHVAHHEPASVRRHGYAFAAGVVVSFWILAGALIALRAAGNSFGWGFQLQQPLFVAFLAMLLLAMALNLFGVFAIGTSMSGAVGRFDSTSGYRGSFMSGVLATVLATPCSAPFMGTAIGYALVQPALKTFLVFSALGGGMALPYLVLSCVPLLLRRLPRPGAWMEHFRQAMAFPLLATVAWLVWIFGQQTGNDGVLGLLFALVLASAGMWIGGRFAGGRFATALTAICLVGSVAVLFSVASPADATRVREAGATTTADGVRWQPWDPDAILRHRSEGRVVFVDFTADWCLSCKVNERVALSGGDFARRMNDLGAIAMKADWTSADPRITKALDDFGRSGVPLYVVYPKSPGQAPIVLPQILTPAIVLEALDRAKA